MDGEEYDPASLVAAVRAVRDRGPVPRPGLAARMAERRVIAGTHARIYRGILARTPETGDLRR